MFYEKEIEWMDMIREMDEKVNELSEREEEMR